MSDNNSVTQVIGASYFRRLFLFRSSVIAVQLMGLSFAIYGLGLNLPVGDILLMMMVYAVFNLFAWQRLQRSLSSSPREFFLHLCVDVLMLAVLFYFSGGSGNPFVSLFLLPLVIVAAILPKPYVWAMAVMTLLCYSLLMVVHVPLEGIYPVQGHSLQQASGFGLHVVGMWFSFLIGVGVILFFVATMAEALRQRDKKLTEAREKYLRDEHVIALGTMAAGAAHELGTPLGTIAVLTKEMEYEYADQPALLHQINILRTQVARCKETLGQLSASAGEMRAVSGRSERVEPYLQQLFGEWQEMHLQTEMAISLNGSEQSPRIVVDETLKQAIFNLLNNAADASVEKIDVSGGWSDDELSLMIRDYGAGLSDRAASEMGKPFFTTKKSGHGLGFYLAQAVFSRLGGHVTISNHPEGGACVVVGLPLNKLMAG